MSFIEQLSSKLDAWHLLKHPYYQAWNHGELSRETLQTYAKEYYHHVAAFPRYISAIHADCADIKIRQLLLGHLIEEEQGDENHPELWQRFAEALGVDRNLLRDSAALETTRKLVDGYFDLVKTNYATGLGALYAYERQTPAVSTSKIAGLTEHYGVNTQEGLQFFTVHQQADEWHTQECEDLLNLLSDEEKLQAEIGAEKAAQLLWQFLDGMMLVHANAKTS